MAFLDKIAQNFALLRALGLLLSRAAASQIAGGPKCDFAELSPMESELPPKKESSSFVM